MYREIYRSGLVPKQLNSHVPSSLSIGFDAREADADVRRAWVWSGRGERKGAHVALPVYWLGGSFRLTHIIPAEHEMAGSNGLGSVQIENVG